MFALGILIPRQFEYHAPSSVEEAIQIAAKYGDEAKLLAGGQSLIPLMKLRLVSPAHLIDLNRIPGLEYIRKKGDLIFVGSLTRMADVEGSEMLKSFAPALTDCAAHVADPLVRNLGTIGGNVCHADPTNDMPAVMIATGAEFVARGEKGERTIKAQDFFIDTFTTALGRDEILTELRIPVESSRVSAYAKLERQAGDFAIAGAAVSLDLRGKSCVGCRIGLTAVGPTVLEAKQAEQELIGSTLDKGAVERAAEKASKECQPVSDLRGSENYKREMVKVALKRAVGLAMSRVERK